MDATARIVRRNPLAFPGRAPGFDPSHIAAPGCVVSAIPSGGNYINLLSGKRGSNIGSPIFSVDGAIGPSSNFSASGNTFTQFNSRTAAAAITLAGFFRSTATSTSTLITPDDNLNQLWIGVPAGAGQFVNVLVNHAGGPSAVPVAANVPYFLIASMVAGGNVNLLLLNLSTGQIITSVFSNSTAFGVGGGTLDIGSDFFNGNAQIHGVVGPVMYSQVYLSKQQMLQWAADPWSFWYPPTTVENLIFAALASPAGSTQSLIADCGGTIEFLSSVRDDRPVIVETTSSVLRDGVLANEMLTNVRRDAVVADELLSSLWVDQSVADETLTTLRCDLALQLEALGLVRGDTAITTEALLLLAPQTWMTVENILTLARDSGLSIEIIRSLIQQNRLSVEALSSLIQQTSEQIENIGQLLIAINAAVPIESLQLFRANQPVTIENIATLIHSSQDMALTLEVVSSISRDTPVNIERTVLTSYDSGLAQENLAEISANSSLLNEIVALIGLHQDTIFTFEQVAFTSRSNPGEIESLAATYRDNLVNTESLIPVFKVSSLLSENVAAIRTDTALLNEIVSSFRVSQDTILTVEFMAATRHDFSAPVESAVQISSDSGLVQENLRVSFVCDNAVLTEILSGLLSESQLPLLRGGQIKYSFQNGRRLVLHFGSSDQMTLRPSSDRLKLND